MHTLITMQQSPCSHFLVAFLGDEGHLASAMVGGSEVDIWDPPPTDSQVVLKSKSNIIMDNEKVMRWVQLFAIIRGSTTACMHACVVFLPAI